MEFIKFSLGVHTVVFIDFNLCKFFLKKIKFSKFYKCFETTNDWYKQNSINKI